MHKRLYIKKYLYTTLLTIASCGHGPSTNVITLENNGKTYTDNLPKQGNSLNKALNKEDNGEINVLAAWKLTKGSKSSSLTLYYNHVTPAFPYIIILNTTFNNSSGRAMPDIDFTATTPIANSYTEVNKDTVKYHIDSSNIMLNNGPGLSANFKLWVTGVAGSKTVSGTINLADTMVAEFKK